MNIPFNGSVSPVCLFPNKEKLFEALKWADIVHIHEPFVPLTFWRLPKNKKYVFTHHAALNQIVCFLLNLLYKLIGRKGISTHVSLLSKQNALTLNKFSHLIPNMFHLNDDLEFKINNHFLFIGRDEKRKNLNLYNNYVGNFYDSKYKYSAITNKHINNKNISTFINPNEQEKREILIESDIYLALNTYGESFGITLIEAINSGNIVISSDIEPFVNLLGNSGIYFENNSLSSLQETIKIIKTKNLLNIWIKQFNHIKKYEINKNMDKLILLYLSL
jgi:glycosyltransferase involved in cell wall biosynthesis